MTEERTQQIKAYQENTDSSFTDYTRFEGDVSERAQKKADFMLGREYIPRYEYNKLDILNDDESLKDKKTTILQAVLELEVAKTEPGANAAEIELYSEFHELRLKKILLVEAARNLHNRHISGGWEVAKDAFAQMNVEVYGEFDTPTYRGMIATEAERVHNFEPSTDNARMIKSDLENSLSRIDVHSEREKPLIDDETLKKLHDVVMKRYENVLSVVPDTEDNVYYNAEQCAEIMNEALMIGGLSESGWLAVVDSKKSNPSTNAAKRTIALPSATRRNANELRRLIVHEQEVHARRGENGNATEFKPLAKGTADYADVEEGLGVLFECAVAGNLDNPSFDRARDRYITAGLALGADGQPRDARQVYEILWRTIAVRSAKDGDISDKVIEKARNQAYGHVENAFRGSAFWMRGVVYTKLKVYYEGLRKNADYITKNADSMDQAIDMAMIGKYNHTSETEFSNVVNALEAKKA